MTPAVTGVFAGLCLALSAPTLAQTPAYLAWPTVEVGAQATFLMPEQNNARAVGGRVTFFQTSRRAFEVIGSHVAGRYRSQYWDPTISSRADLVLGQFRQTLSSSLANGVFMTFGAGVVREVTHYPGYAGFFGPHESATNNLALVGGIGYQRTIVRHLALRGDAQIAATSFGISPLISAGISVPLAPYPAWSRRSTRVASAPTGLPVHLGQTVWVTTTDGAEVHGTVTRVSATDISVAGKHGDSAIAAGVIRRVEAPDSIVNGVTRGLRVGGVAGTGLGFLVSLLCEGDVKCRVSIPLIFGGVGAGVGAATGAVIDGMVDGRRVIYQSHESTPGTRTLSVSPLISRGGTGLRLTLRW